MFRESKKLFHNPVMIMAYIALIIFIVIQSFFVVQSPEYSSFSEDITKLNNDYQQGILTESTDLPAYCNQFSNNQNLIYEEANEKLSFHGYIHSEMLRLSDKMDLPIFADDTAKLQKNYKLLSELQNIPVSFENDMLFRSYQKTNMFLVLLILLAGMGACYILFISDMEVDFLQLFASSKTGIYKLCMQKGGALFAYTSSLFLIKFLIQFLILKLSGYNMGLAIQMVSGGSHFPGILTVGQYLILTMLGACLCILFLIGLFFLIYIVTGSISFSILIASMFLLLEYLADAIISLGSEMVFFKKYNIIYILRSFTMLSVEKPSEQITTWIGVISIAVLAVVILSFLTYTNLHQVRVKPKMKINIHAGLGIFQTMDTVVIKRYLWVLVFLLSYLTFDIARYNTVKSPDVIAFEQMRSEYYGPITDEKLRDLDMKKQEITAAQEQIVSMSDAYFNNELSTEDSEKYEKLVKDTPDLNIFMSVYDEIYEVAKNGGSYYLDNQGTKLWLQTDSELYRTVTFFMIVIPVILFAGIIGERLYRCDIAVLADTSYNRKKYRKNGLILASVNVLLVMFIVYAGRWMKFAKAYPIDLNGSVNAHISVSSNIPMLLYLILFFTALYLMLLNIVLCTVKAVKKFGFMRTIIGAIGIGTVLYVLPIGFRTILVHSKYSVVILMLCIPVFLVVGRIQYIKIMKDHL